MDNLFVDLVFSLLIYVNFDQKSTLTKFILIVNDLRDSSIASKSQGITSQKWQSSNNKNGVIRITVQFAFLIHRNVTGQS